jgi:predicted nucleotidyltransferase component of viral defense system
MDEIRKNSILTEEQKELLLSFTQSPLSSVFYLTGGTALSAFYLHHRLSEDLDFFTEEEVDVESILVFLKSIPVIKQITYERKYDRKIFLLEYPSKISLKVEYTKYPFERLFPVRKFDALMIDSIQDILVNKLMAMTDRRDPKDYIDVYAIIQAYPSLRIEEAIRQVEKKFGIRGVESILSGRFLESPICEGISLVKDIPFSDMQRFFQETARALIRRSID